jgi:hypothetical protein
MKVLAMTKQRKLMSAGVAAAVLTLMAWTAISPRGAVGLTAESVADASEAKLRLKAMADYVGAQKAISFDYDANLEVVTTDKQKLALASSGTVSLTRPDKLRATRSGGFVDIDTVFDGKTLTLLGKNKNVYLKVDTPGSIDSLIGELQNKYNRPLPAADLFLTDAYEGLMPDVIDVKDLGSGVIGGTECDYFAFRTKKVDWQIWIAQGERPYPCRYVIATKDVTDGPQYSIQFRNWKTGGDVAAGDFDFKAPAGARQISLDELKNMKNMGELPSNFKLGGE